MSHLIELTTRNFEQTTKGKWVIDFWAEWCGPCKISSPQFEAAAKAAKAGIAFGNVDVDAHQELAERFQVLSIPTFLFLKDGEVVDRFVGAISKDAILDRASEAF